MLNVNDTEVNAVVKHTIRAYLLSSRHSVQIEYVDSPLISVYRLWRIAFNSFATRFLRVEVEIHYQILCKDGVYVWLFDFVVHP